MKVKLGLGFTSQTEATDLDNHISIINEEDGRELYSIQLTKDNELRISSGDICLINDTFYDGRMNISPQASNVVIISKKKYKS